MQECASGQHTNSVDAWISANAQTSASAAFDVAWTCPLTNEPRQQRWSVRTAQDGSCIASRDSSQPLDIPLHRAVRLQPVVIAKPWGEEIWFSGMESRGESQVEVANGTLPLAAYLALAPQHLCGAAPPVLLKILAPKAQAPDGDLYFELHTQKQEVYVVTHIDRGAWPDGRGAIRMGIDERRLAAAGSAAALRAEFLQAVQEYEQIRRQIDEQTTPATAAQTQLEAQRRRHMESFTRLLPLAVGDVVRVEPYFPHSLQHGVRVVELQTPTYERHIISFAQKVLTQDHWDSATAIADMSLDPAPEPQRSTAPITQIAAFSDFHAWQLNIAPGTEWILPQQAGYGLCIGISGELDCAGCRLGPEQAALIPQMALPARLRNTGSQIASLIIGGPPGLTPPGANNAPTV